MAAKEVDMPGMNGQGPMNQGPRTGRGAGMCQRPGQGMGRGAGMGRGRSGGAGLGRRCRGGQGMGFGGGGRNGIQDRAGTQREENER